MDRLGNNLDQGLLKIIRNLSYWTFCQQQGNDEDDPGSNRALATRGLWSPHIKLLLELTAETSDQHDLLIELLGTLANMTPSDLPSNSSWPKLMRDFALVPLCSKLLVPGMAQVSGWEGL